jgi:hypothetical protein
MVCAGMACFVLESSECGKSGSTFAGPGLIAGDISEDQADQGIIQGQIP